MTTHIVPQDGAPSQPSTVQTDVPTTVWVTLDEAVTLLRVREWLTLEWLGIPEQTSEDWRIDLRQVQHLQRELSDIFTSYQAIITENENHLSDALRYRHLVVVPDGSIHLSPIRAGDLVASIWAIDGSVEPHALALALEPGGGLAVLRADEDGNIDPRRGSLAAQITGYVPRSQTEGACDDDNPVA